MKKLQQLKYNLLTKGFGVYINTMHYFVPQKASNLAYQLFATPRKGLLKEIPTFLNTSKNTTLKYQNQKIQTYHWKGHQHKILFIHGWESNALRWQSVIDYFRSYDVEMIALDAPGQGLSGGKELNAIVYSQFLNEVCNYYKPDILIGHSLGGMTMLYYLATYQPTFIKKAIALGAPNSFMRITDDYKKLLSLSQKSYNGFLNQFSQRFKIDPAHFESKQFIDKINIPLAIIHDELDKIVPFSDALEMINNNNHIAFLPSKGFGHGLYDDSLNKQMLNFIENSTFA